MFERILKTIRELYRGEPLFWAGALGLGLGLVCFAGMTVHGLVVEPEGNLYKAASFDIAVGIFLLTLALVAKKADFTPRGGNIWRFSLIGLAVFGYGVETIQIFRGLDPRFSRVASPADQLLGGLFFLSALGIFVLFLVLTVRFFFRPTTGPDGPLVLGLRYGAAASILAFVIGIAMSVLGSPRLGETGNLLPLHAAGFHGLQAVPIIALFLGWAGHEAARAKRAVHWAGFVWLAACLAIAWQSFAGRSVLEPSLATAAALGFLGVWAAIFGRALTSCIRGGAWRTVLAT